MIIDGEVVVQLEKEDVERETEKWRCALIVYIIGECPGYNTMNRFISQTWNNITEPTVYLHEEGYFIVKFQTIEKMREILYAGPYTINYRPLILKPWTPDFNFSEEFPTEIPLWVKLPQLPMNCWGSNSLSRISSSIGTPIYADECTAKQTRVSFARMLIEINITKPLPDEIKVLDPNGKLFTQPVTYDWRPLYCEVCQSIGHKCSPVTAPAAQARPRRRATRRGPKLIQAWVSKEPNQAQEGQQVTNPRDQPTQVLHSYQSNH
ncbi:uncharacterized protein LOC132629783 [Lycium barbarum]|uniref:uncharacterized protein LOC132629783 n=1 Tax=Lycium barbarum TaxID=112863 RepID=UPI00293E0F78|nr:uncharacterized protein LOC132629783 [Lycium barbarum]